MAIWTPPRYHEASPLEVYVGTTLNELADRFYDVFHGTLFEYWFLDPKGQHNLIVIASMLFIVLWFVCIQYSIRSTLASSNVSRPSSPRAPFSPPMERPETHPYQPLLPTMRQLAPPGHRPTNAQLNVPPFHVAPPMGRRTGRTTNPGYQTPFKEKPAEAKIFSTGASVSKINFENDDFPSLATATGRMATYRKLHGNDGMLHPGATQDEGRM
ncbi:hypothetical protein Ptr902_03981 [Pyrenophora tritici-repentis]|nr:hypothetical protein Ptr902_03981 [Pyrenophora tritici-repentis]